MEVYVLRTPIEFGTHFKEIKGFQHAKSRHKAASANVPPSVKGGSDINAVADAPLSEKGRGLLVEPYPKKTLHQLSGRMPERVRGGENAPPPVRTKYVYKYHVGSVGSFSSPTYTTGPSTSAIDSGKGKAIS
ncbi:hypothetical protein Scep_004892 [Stephania cephalantha]|uniref:Uncharacterized protein n=1 Tax=Stephania cephalantha TaxID=152367 RepID=A0AAP0PVU3_9MAGN